MQQKFAYGFCEEEEIWLLSEKMFVLDKKKNWIANEGNYWDFKYGAKKSSWSFEFNWNQNLLKLIFCMFNSKKS